MELAYTPWRQGLLTIFTRNRLILYRFLEFGPPWPILMHAEERDDFTDSKHVSLRRRVFEQFGMQVFHCASLCSGFVLQQVQAKKPAKS